MHDEKRIRYSVDSKQRKNAQIAVILNARFDAYEKGLPMPDESNYVFSDDDDEDRDDYGDYENDFAPWSSFAEYDDFHDDAAC